MNNPKVSVIIPVYNTEQYVQQTVESIVQQTLQDIEIIIINDGSTDNSLAMINLLAQKDQRINVYSQANQGLSVTRNNGIKRAKGEFIYFMDSDDLLESDTLKICYQKCIAEQLDFVFFDAESFYDDHIPLREYQYQRNLNIEDKIWNGTELLKIQDDTWNYRSSACLSFVKLSFIQQHQIQFYPNILHEDELYTALLYLEASRINYIKRTFFKRRVRHNSIVTSKFSMKNIQGYFTIANELNLYSNQHPNHASLIHSHVARMLNAAVRNSCHIPSKERLKIAKLCLSKYKKYITYKTIGILLFKSFISFQVLERMSKKINSSI